MNTVFEKRNAQAENRLPGRGPIFGFRFSILASVLIGVHLWLIPVRAQEVVVNLSAGRVIVCVAKGGIVVATVGQKLEAESRPPMAVELSGRRVAVLLGATEWVSPAGDPPVRMERELPRVGGALGAAGPRLQKEQASDLEALGLGLLEPLRSVAGQLHQNVGLKRDEPLVDVVLVGYLEGYGAEAWTLRYRAAQEPLRGEYWQTRVLRPLYTQLYPPEKDQPRTLMEVRYPDAGDPRGAAEERVPLLLELLRGNDPRVAAARASDEKAAEAAEKILAGESHKAPLEGVVTLLRAALDATVPQDAVMSFGVIDERTGFSWILPPPAPVERAEEGDKKRPPGAPTLRKPPQ